MLRALGQSAERWQPHPGLALDRSRLSTALVDGAGQAAPWLRHPCVSRLTRGEPATAYRDLVLALWTAAHTDADLGSVTISTPVTIWTAGGDVELPAGRHELCTVAETMKAVTPIAVSVDVWCTTTGLRSPGAYAIDDDLTVHEGLTRDLNHFVRIMHVVATRLPELTHWLTSATKVVRPLVPVPGCSRSTHYPDIAGLIEADLSRGIAQTIELVTHETAHLHLRAAQADDPLVDPGDNGRYPSPLRPEPRPLVGILLAYHALAYIAAALCDAAEGGLLDETVEAYVRSDVEPKRDDARAVLDGAEGQLTDAGRRFLRQTHEVSDCVNI
ncbi:aKG-HExxH-type peptide beta-hydroxylase [Kribbella alba]|uniref:aKG-HExxH-type peptide beta-hydroxylase n=1 Tax=Kribbella alba TaxID=190197 RepID=UPI0031D279AD